MFVRASYTRGASDVWVLGISLYRMLVGSYPFKATNDHKLINKMLNADFIIPDHFSEGK
jgi:serine/threonine protein kinase